MEIKERAVFCIAPLPDGKIQYVCVPITDASHKVNSAGSGKSTASWGRSLTN